MQRPVTTSTWLALAAGIMLTSFGVSLVRADTELIFGQLQDDEKSIATQRIRIKGDRLSIDGGTDQPYMIFYGNYNRAYVIDHEKRQYLSLDPEKVTKIVSNMMVARQEALADMERQLKTLPKDEQAAMQDVIDGLRKATVEMENAPERKVEFKATGKRVELGGHETDVVEAFVAGKKTSTYYLVGRKDLEISDSDYQVIKDFVSFLKLVEGRLPAAMRSHFGNMDMLAAPDEKLPLKVEAADGRPEILIGASVKPIEAKVMNVPASYAPQQLPDATAQ